MNVLPTLKQWLFRFGRDERLPVILTQRRIFIVPTRAGMLFAVVLCVMLLGAVNYNLSLGHALVFLLASLGLVAMVHTFRNLVALRLTHGRADPVFAGDVALFAVLLENTRQQPRRALELAFGRQPGRRIDIPGGQRVVVAVPCQAIARGRLDPGRLSVTTRYPLGLFHAWSYAHPAFSCLVYPRPIETPLPPFAGAAESGFWHGDNGQEDFTGLRLRQANDSPRHIAWKSVARDIESRTLLVKQFAGGASEQLQLDWALTDAAGSVDHRLSILAGWVIAAERR